MTRSPYRGCLKCIPFSKMHFSAKHTELPATPPSKFLLIGASCKIIEGSTKPSIFLSNRTSVLCPSTREEKGFSGLVDVFRTLRRVRRGVDNCIYRGALVAFPCRVHSLANRGKPKTPQDHDVDHASLLSRRVVLAQNVRSISVGNHFIVGCIILKGGICYILRR